MFYVGQLIQNKNTLENHIYLGCEGPKAKFIDNGLKVYTISRNVFNNRFTGFFNTRGRLIKGPFYQHRIDGLWLPNNTQKWNVKKYLLKR